MSCYNSVSESPSRTPLLALSKTAKGHVVNFARKARPSSKTTANVTGRGVGRTATGNSRCDHSSRATCCPRGSSTMHALPSAPTSSRALPRAGPASRAASQRLRIRSAARKSRWPGERRLLAAPRSVLSPRLELHRGANCLSLRGQNLRRASAAVGVGKPLSGAGFLTDVVNRFCTC